MGKHRPIRDGKTDQTTLKYALWQNTDKIVQKNEWINGHKQRMTEFEMRAPHRPFSCRSTNFFVFCSILHNFFFLFMWLMVCFWNEFPDRTAGVVFFDVDPIFSLDYNSLAAPIPTTTVRISVDTWISFRNNVLAKHTEFHMLNASISSSSQLDFQIKKHLVGRTDGRTAVAWRKEMKKYNIARFIEKFLTSLPHNFFSLGIVHT